MTWNEQRDRLMSKAADDERAIATLAADPAASDTIIGFHAQQAVEKLLKALLCHLQIDFKRTHDLVALLDAVTDAGRLVPPDIEKAKFLQPYAVQFRYEDPTVAATDALDRDDVQRDVAAARL